MQPRLSRHAWAIVLWISSLSPVQGAEADPWDVWHWRHPLPAGHALSRILFANETFVAIGDHTFLTSTTGSDWTTTHPAQLEGVRGLAVVGDEVFTTSDDGSVWRLQEGRPWEIVLDIDTAPWNNLRQADGRLFALGDEGRILTSHDGIGWVDRSPETSRHLLDVAEGNGAFVAVGSHHTLLRSSDGSAWDSRIPISGSADLTVVVFGNGRFIAAGQQGTILHSVDGVHWTRAAVPTSAEITTLLPARGRFLAGSVEGEILVSDDGHAWTQLAAEFSEPIQDIAFDGERFVAIGPSVSLWTSANGETWQREGSPYRSLLTDVTFGQARFVAAGVDGLILSSPNGHDWTASPFATDQDLHAVIYALSRFVTVGRGGSILSSVNGLDWEPVESPTDGWIRGVAAGADRLIAVTQLGESLVSTNGENWTTHILGQNLLLSGVVFGSSPERFVAFGSLDLFYSPDGLLWNRTQLPTEEWLADVCYGNGRFLAAGGEGGVYASENGIDWSLMAYLDGVQPRSVAYAQDRFLITTPGFLWSSTNGLAWTVHETGTTRDLRAIASNQDTLVIVGEMSTILQSSPAPGGAIRIGAPQWSPVQGFSFEVQLPALTPLTLEVADDLGAWRPLTDWMPTNRVETIRDESSTEQLHRFYRIVARTPAMDGDEERGKAEPSEHGGAWGL